MALEESKHVEITQKVTLEISQEALRKLVRSVFGISEEALISIVPVLHHGDERNMDTALGKVSSATGYGLVITSESNVDTNPLHNLHARIKSMMAGNQDV